jgi:hypothetical protein
VKRGIVSLQYERDKAVDGSSRAPSEERDDDVWADQDTLIATLMAERAREKEQQQQQQQQQEESTTVHAAGADGMLLSPLPPTTSPDASLQPAGQQCVGNASANDDRDVEGRARSDEGNVSGVVLRGVSGGEQASTQQRMTSGAPSAATHNTAGVLAGGGSGRGRIAQQVVADVQTAGRSSAQTTATAAAAPSSAPTNFMSDLKDKLPAPHYQEVRSLLKSYK